MLPAMNNINNNTIQQTYNSLVQQPNFNNNNHNNGNNLVNINHNNPHKNYHYINLGTKFI